MYEKTIVKWKGAMCIGDYKHCEDQETVRFVIDASIDGRNFSFYNVIFLQPTSFSFFLFSLSSASSSFISSNALFRQIIFFLYFHHFSLISLFKFSTFPLLLYVLLWLPSASSLYFSSASFPSSSSCFILCLRIPLA